MITHIDSLLQIILSVIYHELNEAWAICLSIRINTSHFLAAWIGQSNRDIFMMMDCDMQNHDGQSRVIPP